MKKLFLLFAAIGLSGIFMLSGCKGDEDPVPQGDPTIEFVVEEGFIHTDATLPTATEFKVKVLCNQNTETTSLLATLEASRTFTATKSTLADTTYTWDLGNVPSIEAEISLWTNGLLGLEDFEFTVIDANGNTASLGFTITTIGNLEEYSDVTIGSWNDPAGSFFASTTGEVMVKDDATANSAAVDFFFFLGASNGSAFGGPTDVSLEQVFDICANCTTNWDTYNDTKFINPAPIGYAEFDAIGENYIFPEFDDVSATTIASQLATNDVVFFKTAAGKLGYIRINSINGRGDQANIDVKVQK